MTPQELLNSLEILSQTKGLVDVVLLLPRGPAKTRSDIVGVTAQDLRDFVKAVKQLQKPGQHLK